MTINIPTHIRMATDAKQYILGGRAVVTLTSNTTNKFLTYKITVAKNNASIHFVWVHTNHGYRYLCTIKRSKGIVRSEKSMPRHYLSYKAFVWAWRHISNNSMPRTLAVYHNNTCCRCGRALTTMKSMAAGIGPECAKRT